MADIFDRIAEKKLTAGGDIFDRIAEGRVSTSQTIQPERKRRGFFELFKAGAIAEQKTLEAIAPHVQRQTAKLLPFAADIGLTALVPQIGIPLKAGRGVKAGLSLLNLFGRGGASAVGGGGGKALEQLITGEDVSRKEIEKEALIGAGGEAVISTLAGAGKFLGGKLRGVTGVALDVLSEFSGITKTLTRRAEKILTTARNKIVGDTTQRALEFSRSLGDVPGEEVGLKIGQALRRKVDWDKVYEEPNEIIKLTGGELREIDLEDSQGLFEALVDSFRGETTILKTGHEIPIYGPRATDRAITNALRWLGIENKSREGRFLRDFYTDSIVRPADANFIIKKIWKSFAGDTKKVVQWKEAFKSDIVEDIQREAATSINFAEALAKSDEIFKNTKNWFSENPVAQKIIGKMNPENVIPNLSRLSPSQLNTLREGIIKEPGGKEAWAGFEMNFIQDLYRGAFTKTKDTGEARVLPALLADLLNDAKAKILAINPDTWAAVKKEADFYSKVAPEFKELKLQNGMDLFNAWGVLSPGSKKTLRSLTREKLIPQTFRGISKVGLRLGGRELFNQSQ